MSARRLYRARHATRYGPRKVLKSAGAPRCDTVIARASANSANTGLSARCVIPSLRATSPGHAVAPGPRFAKIAST